MNKEVAAKTTTGATSQIAPEIPAGAPTGTPGNTTARGWIVCSLAVITAIVMGLNYYSVPGTMGLLLEDLGIGETLGGWLFTACLIVSVVFALPGGVLVDRFGPLKIGMSGICCTIVGAVLGAVAPDYTILLVSRVIEGIGPALITVCVPVLISAWFAPEKRGFLMTLFSLWIGLGIFFIFNITNVLVDPADPSSWRVVWWFCAIVTTVTGVLYALLVRMPALRADAQELAESVADGSANASVLQGFKSLPTWLLALTFVAFAFGVDSFTTFAPMYCIDVLGFDPIAANSDSSLITVGMIIGGLVMAFLLIKISSFKARIRLTLIAVILTVCTYPLMYGFQAGWAVPFFVVTGIILQAFPAITFTIAPETAKSPAFVGATMGVVALSQSLGIGGVISGAVIEQSGYPAMLYVMLLVGAIELICVIALMFALKKRQEA